MRLLLAILMLIGPAAAAFPAPIAAYWGGRTYTGPVCARKSCSMCYTHPNSITNQIARQKAQQYQPVQRVAYSQPTNSQPSPQQEYRTEYQTKYRTETYRVKRCNGRQCWYETRTRQVPYQVAVRVPVKRPTSQSVTSPAASSPMSTPYEAVDTMLGIANVQPTEVVCDIGFGDGRILEAALKLGAYAMGVELNKDFYDRTAKRLSKYDSRHYAITWGDATHKKFSSADVITMYLFPDLIAELNFTDLKPGTRIVSYQHDIPGKETKEHVCHINGEDHYIYVHTVPPKFENVVVKAEDINFRLVRNTNAFRPGDADWGI